MLLSIPILLLISVYSNEIMIILYGKQWVNAGIYMKLLMYASIFMIIENSSYLLSAGLQGL